MEQVTEWQYVEECMFKQAQVRRTCGYIPPRQNHAGALRSLPTVEIATRNIPTLTTQSSTQQKAAVADPKTAVY